MACERASAPQLRLPRAQYERAAESFALLLLLCFPTDYFLVFCPYFPGIILICGGFSVILPRPRSGGGSVISAPGLPNPLAGAWITNHPALFFHFVLVYRFLLPFSPHFFPSFAASPHSSQDTASSVRRQRFRALRARRGVYGFLIAAAELACSASG